MTKIEQFNLAVKRLKEFQNLPDGWFSQGVQSSKPTESAYLAAMQFIISLILSDLFNVPDYTYHLMPEADAGIQLDIVKNDDSVSLEVNFRASGRLEAIMYLGGDAVTGKGFQECIDLASATVLKV